MPIGSVAVVRVAWPFDTLALPMTVPLYEKVTVPVSPEPVAGNTLAVNVIGSPEVDGFAELPSSTSVGAWLTVTSAAVPDVLAPKSESPPNEAAMESTPSGRVVRSMLVVVTPAVVVSTEVPIGVPSSVKVTVPVGFAVPALGVTVAVKETASPVVDVRDDAVTTWWLAAARPSRSGRPSRAGNRRSRCRWRRRSGLHRRRRSRCR